MNLYRVDMIDLLHSRSLRFGGDGSTMRGRGGIGLCERRGEGWNAFLRGRGAGWSVSGSGREMGGRGSGCLLGNGRGPRGGNGLGGLALGRRRRRVRQLVGRRKGCAAL